MVPDRLDARLQPAGALGAAKKRNDEERRDRGDRGKSFRSDDRGGGGGGQARPYRSDDRGSGGGPSQALPL